MQAQAQTDLRQGDDRRQKQDNPTRGDLGRETISVRSERMSRTCHRSQCKRCPPRARRYQLDGPRAASRHRTLKVASIPGAATSSWNSFFLPKTTVPPFFNNGNFAGGRAPTRAVGTPPPGAHGTRHPQGGGRAPARRHGAISPAKIIKIRTRIRILRIGSERKFRRARVRASQK